MLLCIWQVEGAVQAQLLLLPKDKELTHEKAVHGKTAGHLSEEKLQRGILAEKHAVKVGRGCGVTVALRQMRKAKYAHSRNCGCIQMSALLSVLPPLSSS